MIKQLNKVLSIAAISALFLSPALTWAKSLTIVNDTHSEFTVSINNYCSDVFGVMKAHSSGVMSEVQLKALCGTASSYCEARIYKSKDCGGKELAAFLFDSSKGIKNSVHVAKGYTLTANYQLNTVWLTQAL